MIYKSPLGPLKLEATAEGVCAVKYLFGKHSDSEATGLPHTKPEKDRDGGPGQAGTVAEATPSSKRSKAEEHLQVCQAWLDAYFAGTLLQSNPVPKPTLVLPSTGI